MKKLYSNTFRISDIGYNNDNCYHQWGQPIPFNFLTEYEQQTLIYVIQNYLKQSLRYIKGVEWSDQLHY